MLGDFKTHTTIAVKDIDRALKWYDEKLGLKGNPVTMEKGSYFTLPSGTEFYLYQSESAGKAEHTLMSFAVTGIEEVMTQLKSRGVEFENYDYTDDNGLAIMGEHKGAWFRDSEGNILAISEGPANS